MMVPSPLRNPDIDMIRKDEREKVLDGLRDWLTDYIIQRKITSSAYSDIIDKLAEIRREGTG